MKTAALLIAVLCSSFMGVGCHSKKPEPAAAVEKSIVENCIFVRQQDTGVKGQEWFKSYRCGKDEVIIGPTWTDLVNSSKGIRATTSGANSSIIQNNIGTVTIDGEEK
jgi:sarcosine oxidase delta subunit